MTTHKLSLLVIALLALFSCSTDDSTDPIILENTTSVEIETPLESQMDMPAEDQTPATQLDTTKQGIYNGVVASGHTQSRGKVWINLGNNTQYTATVKMVDGETMSFQGVRKSTRTGVSYLFANDNGSFTVTENTVRRPEITDVMLNNEPYFMYAVKRRGGNTSNIFGSATYTGTFQEDGGSRMGTWNIMADGSNLNPNFMFGNGISDLMVTFNGTMEGDTTFEASPNFTCLGNSNPWIPIADLFEADGDGVLAFEQSSTLFGGTVTWDLGFSSGLLGGYVDVNCDNSATSGIYTFTGPGGANLTGTINID